MPPFQPRHRKMDLIFAEDLLFEENGFHECYCEEEEERDALHDPKFASLIMDKVFTNPAFLSCIDREQFRSRFVSQNESDESGSMSMMGQVLSDALESCLLSFLWKVDTMPWVRVTVVIEEEPVDTAAFESVSICQTVLPVDVVRFFEYHTLVTRSATHLPAPCIEIDHDDLLSSKMLTLFVFLIVPDAKLREHDTPHPFSPLDVRYMSNNLAECQLKHRAVACTDHLIVRLKRLFA
jgi:hypothetical protein